MIVMRGGWLNLLARLLLSYSYICGRTFIKSIPTYLPIIYLSMCRCTQGLTVWKKVTNPPNVRRLGCFPNSGPGTDPAEENISYTV